MSEDKYEVIAMLLKFSEEMANSLRGALVLADTGRDPMPNLKRAESSLRQAEFLARAAFEFEKEGSS